MLKRVDVALLPGEAVEMHADAYVVVDVLRATTTIAVLFERGLADLVVAMDIDFARERAFAEARLLFGEVQGLKPEGFDYGNSPVEAIEADLSGRGAVLYTTNGTLALCSLAGRGTVYSGAPANASSLSRRLRRHDSVVIVCAGTERGQRFALEDFAAAGLLVRELQRLQPEGLSLGDAAMLAGRLAGKPFQTVALSYGSGEMTDKPLTMPSTGQMMVSASTHALRLKEIGLEADVRFCARLNTSRATPIIVESGDGWARLANPA